VSSRLAESITTQFPLVEEVLGMYADVIGADLVGYRNHVYRGLNYYRQLAGVDEVPRPVLIASAFHDIGIWTDRTFDYLAPSVRQAQRFLETRGFENLGPEVRALIEHHHKLRPYTQGFADNVEPYRRADLVDVTLGCVRFGLARSYVRSVKARLPDAGFHRRLAALTLQQTLRTPWRPLPMLRW
jgi:hypothetical protein